MSASSHPRGAGEGAAKEAAAPSSGLYLGAALIERTANAVELIVARHEAASDLYLSLVAEMFAATDGPSQNLSFLDGPSVSANAGRACTLLGGRDARTPAAFALSEPSLTLGPVVGGGSVRAGAQDAAGGAAVQPGASGIALETK